MAVLALKDAYVELNSVDISDWVKKVELPWEIEELDTTAMGANGKTRIGGLEDFELGLTLNQDFAASAIDQTIWPLRGTVTTFKVRPTSAAKSSTNPEYAGSVLIKEYPPIGNEVGELAEVEVTWPGSGLLTRATS